MDKKNKTSTTGKEIGGLMSVLTIVLVAAKAFGFAHYSWLIAFMPTIFSIGGSLFILLTCAIIVGIVFIFDVITKRV